MSDNTNTTPIETQQRVSEKVIKKGKQTVDKKFNKLERLVVVYIDVNLITANDYNPNRQSDHDFELLLKSMGEDGFTQPVVVLEAPITCDDGIDRFVIVDGEHRWRAAATLGYTEIPAVKVDMTPAQARISTIRHNRARGSHDLDLEAELLRDLRDLGALDIAIDSLIMDDTEVQKLLDDIPAPVALAGETYDQAWVPDKFSDDERDLISTGVANADTLITAMSDGGEKMMAMTSEAIATQRKREGLIAQAKTEQDRQAIAKGNQLYRVLLIFENEQAAVVKRVLGKRAAEKLYELCEAADNLEDK